MRASKVENCANPDCGAEFRRLGTGTLYTLHVNRPQPWGLPEHIKQKVVWLCSRCSQTHEVQFDQQHCQVLVIRRERSRRQSA